MKRWISLLGVFLLTTLSPASIIACGNNPQQPKTSETTLFNNKYGLLNNSFSITNQSIQDYSFFTYDLSYAKNKTLHDKSKTPLYKIFLVNEYGTLTLDSKITIPNEDINNVTEIKAQVINTQTITLIFNAVIGEHYTNHYNDSNNPWTYFEQDNHSLVNISKQNNAEYVENNYQLSEATGMYYIVKALRAKLITKDSAYSLAKYFFDNSTLKDKLNEKLIYTIIDYFNDKDNIYNFIQQSSILNGVNKQNCAMNYVLDNDNNLIEIYYYQSDISANFSYKYQDWYNGNSSGSKYHFAIENKVKLISWKNYANSWTQFINNYPKIAFNKNSVFSSIAWSKTVNTDLTIPYDSKNISDKEPIISATGYDYPSDYAWCCIAEGWVWGGIAYQYLYSFIRLWYDDENIYFKIEGYEISSNASTSAQLLINLNNITLFK